MKNTSRILGSRSLFFVGLLALLGSCMSTEPIYHRSERSWEEQLPPAVSELKHTVFLIGDVGAPTLDPLEPALVFLKTKLDRASEHSSVIFLGDNIYHAGLPEPDHPERKKAESIIGAQLGILDKFKGRPFFVPGNHDWNAWSAGGRLAIRRQEKYIEEYLGRDDVMFPSGGCGDPVAIEVEDDVTLILIDSQWYLHDWEGEPNMHEGCDVKSLEDFKVAFNKLVDAHSDGSILIAMHHPIYTNGSHGGYFPLKSHLFPFTSFAKKFYFPLPIIGSLYPLLRTLGVSNQDVPHHFNKEYAEVLLDATEKKGHISFASGHEHALEYFEDRSIQSDRHFIVSGSGCKYSYVKRNSQLDFGYMYEGFAQMNYYKDGQVWMEFWAPEGEGKEGKLLFRKQVKERTLAGEMTTNQNLNIPKTKVLSGDTIYAANKGQRRWLGKLYRDAWGAPIEFPVLDLETFEGGVIPERMGMGLRTKVLGLQNTEGKQWVLHSVAKDASSIIPKQAQGTVLQAFVQDLSSMAHPYGETVVPSLAEAAGVFHTNPRYYYVPKQARLGDFSDEFGNQVYLLEELPSSSQRELSSFGKPEDIITNFELTNRIKESHDHVVDQEATLQARLFDIWLGDWDRDDDQWRWGLFEEKGKKIYRPIPGDRDQVFIQINGIIPILATREWGLRYFQDFDKNIRDIQGLNFNARHFDRSYLTKMDAEAWRAKAVELQKMLTDSVIEAAIRQWPDTLYHLNGPEIIEKLKIRRDRLEEFAQRYYKFLAKEVDVVGTHGNERFEVIRSEKGRTKVIVYHLNTGGKQREQLFERTFYSLETKEIRLFGLKGDDSFFLSGGGDEAGIRIRIIGGDGNDLVQDNSETSNVSTIVYDDLQANNRVNLGKNGKDKRSKNPKDNVYDREAFKLNGYIPLILPGFNPDDGLRFGIGAIITRHGFHKSPYKNRQIVVTNFAFATQAINGSYKGDFIDVFGKWDFHLEAEAYAPSYVRNYFGLGNETIYTEANDEDFNFNRLRMARVRFFPGIKQTFNGRMHTVKFGPFFDYNKVEETEGRFVSQDDTRSADDFEAKNYAGLQFEYHLNATKRPVLPQEGYRFNFYSGWYSELGGEKNFVQLNTDISFYQRLYPAPIILASRIGYGNNYGSYDFFQAQALGRRDNLRGFRAERFAGDEAFYHNTNLLVSFYRSKNYYLPFTLGLLGFFDYGRVWLEGENSSRWHNGYGGGLVFVPYSAALLSFTYTKSSEFDIIELKANVFF